MSSSNRRGLFITGTDTDVGKTVTTCALARALRGRGIDVGVMKPVETGVPADGPADAMALREAAAAGDALEEICPQRFALPAAPSVAAAHEGRKVDLTEIRRVHAALAARHEMLLVEGAGGLLVPVTPEVTMAGLAVRLDLPILVVARAALGTINHTLLTLEAAAGRGLQVAGVVISHAGALSAADASNLDELRQRLGKTLVGEIPFLSPGEEPAADALDLDAILSAAGASPAIR